MATASQVNLDQDELTAAIAAGLGVHRDCVRLYASTTGGRTTVGAIVTIDARSTTDVGVEGYQEALDRLAKAAADVDELAKEATRRIKAGLLAGLPREGQ